MPRLYYASPRDLPETNPAPGITQRLVVGDRTTMAMTDFAPRTVLDTHKHDVERIGVVTRGSLVMVVAGEQRILNPGDTFRIPAGTSHGARVFEEPTQVIETWVTPSEVSSGTR